ncbi:MAG: CPBP family glutamic-type intramembrane protease [Archaeoglobaceae archaeon]
MREFDTYILLSLFLLFNLNFLLRILVGGEALTGWALTLNLIPIVVIAFIPFYLLVRGDLRKYVDILVFAIIVVYPLSQLYTMVLKKFVAIVVTGYVIYVFISMIKEKNIQLKDAFKKLVDFDEVAVHQIREIARKNKEFYYVYLLIWLFIISDVILFLPPKFFGIWEHTHYHEILGIEPHVGEYGLPIILITLLFILIVSYPIIEGYFRRTKFVVPLVPLFILFLSYPTVVLSPILKRGTYGVILDIKPLVELPVVDILVPFIVILLILALFKLFDYPIREELGWLSRSIVLGISSAYILVFLYSLYYEGITASFVSPNVILFLFLMGFFIFSLIYLPYLSGLRIRSAESNFPVEILFLLILAMLFSSMPSIYTTLALAFYSAFFVLREIKLERFAILLYVIVLMLNGYLIFLAMAFLVFGVFSDFRKIPRDPRFYLIIPIFVILSYIVGERIPFEVTLAGIASLIVLSGSEEVVFKRFMFDRMAEKVGRIAVPIAFCLIHLLSLTTLNYYLVIQTLPLFVVYLVGYQYVTIRMYEKNRNIIPFVIIHALINVFSLVLKNYLPIF